MASFTKIRELLLLSLENNTIEEEEFSYSPKNLNQYTFNQMKRLEQNQTEQLVLLSYTFYRG